MVHRSFLCYSAHATAFEVLLGKHFSVVAASKTQTRLNIGSGALVPLCPLNGETVS